MGEVLQTQSTSQQSIFLAETLKDSLVDPEFLIRHQRLALVEILLSNIEGSACQLEESMDFLSIPEAEREKWRHSIGVCLKNATKNPEIPFSARVGKPGISLVAKEPAETSCEESKAPEIISVTQNTGDEIRELILKDLEVSDNGRFFQIDPSNPIHDKEHKQEIFRATERFNDEETVKMSEEKLAILEEMKRCLSLGLAILPKRIAEIAGIDEKEACFLMNKMIASLNSKRGNLLTIKTEKKPDDGKVRGYFLDTKDKEEFSKTQGEQIQEMSDKEKTALLTIIRYFLEQYFGTNEYRKVSILFECFAEMTEKSKSVTPELFCHKAQAAGIEDVSIAWGNSFIRSVRERGLGQYNIKILVKDSQYQPVLPENPEDYEEILKQATEYFKRREQLEELATKTKKERFKKRVIEEGVRHIRVIPKHRKALKRVLEFMVERFFETQYSSRKEVIDGTNDDNLDKGIPFRWLEQAAKINEKCREDKVPSILGFDIEFETYGDRKAILVPCKFKKQQGRYRPLKVEEEIDFDMTTFKLVMGTVKTINRPTFSRGYIEALATNATKGYAIPANLTPEANNISAKNMSWGAKRIRDWLTAKEIGIDIVPYYENTFYMELIFSEALETIRQHYFGEELAELKKLGKCFEKVLSKKNNWHPEDKRKVENLIEKTKQTIETIISKIKKGNQPYAEILGELEAAKKEVSRQLKRLALLVGQFKPKELEETQRINASEFRDDIINLIASMPRSKEREILEAILSIMAKRAVSHMSTTIPIINRIYKPAISIKRTDLRMVNRTLLEFGSKFEIKTSNDGHRHVELRT
jgi:hypothetical protein